MASREAAIWARKSTADKSELSLPGQIDRCRAKLEDEGYYVPENRILTREAWSSLDLSACPEFQTLKQWVYHGEISALAVLDRDRLNATPEERIAFFGECRELGVKILICQGPPIIDEPEGILVEASLAVGKLRSVWRAQQGSRDGLYDRLRLKRKPSMSHRVRGYDWDGERRLVPNIDYWQVEYALHQVLQGAKLRGIQRELSQRGVQMSHSVLHGWLHSPIYAGHYYGHRKEAITPIKRKGDTSGKTSTRLRPFGEWYHLPEVEIVNPPITWEQYLAIQEMLHQNQMFALRNAKRTYKLRGRIICDFHNKKYRGRPIDNAYRYWCPVGKCGKPTLHGPRLESEVEEYCQDILTSPEILDTELSKYRKGKHSLEDKLNRDMNGLERKVTRCLNEEMDLERKNLRGDIDSEVYTRLKASLRGERSYYRDLIEAIQSDMDCLQQKKQALTTLREIRERLGHKLHSATVEEWWAIYTLLDLWVHVRENGNVEIEAGIPLSSERDFVFSIPRAVEHKKQYPLRATLSYPRYPNNAGVPE